MSENKEDSNSTPSDVKEEEKSAKSEETKNIDESSKDSEKDSAKDDSTKDDSAKEDSVKDESEKEDSEEEEGMGLLDRPVEVTGCRARKKVERLELSFATPKDKVSEIVEGKGDKLGDCPIIEFQIQRNLINDLKALHKILFNRFGSGNEIKKNIRKFSGFTFAKGSQDYDRKKSSLDKLTSTILKHVCEILDLERGGTKEDIVTRIMEFLLTPKNSGKVPKKKTSSKDKKKTPKKTDSKKAKAKKEASSSDGGDSANESASEASAEDDGKDNSGSDIESKKKSKNTSKAKKAPSKPAAKKVEKKEKNKKEEKKTVSKGIKRKRDDDDDDDDDSVDSSDGEPTAKKTKMPSDDEIKKLVKRILDAADLQEITMKKVIKQVADAYPECDLSHKKAFIKTTIKSVIS